MKFYKMNGIGNDFLILDARNFRQFTINPGFIKKISNRYFGIGCDQFIIITKTVSNEDFVVFYNMDGSEASACGNATRCVASLIAQEKSSQISLETQAGLMECNILNDGTVRVKMPVPIFSDTIAKRAQIKLCNAHDIFKNPSLFCEIPNPHYVIFGKIDMSSLEKYGNIASEDTSIFTDRSNIEFVDIKTPSEITVFVYERGSGITLACGTGACAAVASGIKLGFLEKNVAVTMLGSQAFGQKINIEWDGEDGNLYMTGPVSNALEISLEKAEKYISTPFEISAPICLKYSTF